MNRAWSRFLAWGPEATGPTHSLALLRIAMAALSWCAWARELALHQRPGLLQAALGLVFLVSSLMMMAGFCTRAATAATAAVALVCCYVCGSFLRMADFAHHNQYLLACAMTWLALSPCGRVLSVDRLLATRRAARGGAPPAPVEGPLWALRLIALQVSAVYLWGAVDKLDPSFLAGVRMQHTFFTFYFAGGVPDSTWWIHGCRLLAWTVVALEFALAFGLHVPRWQPVLMTAGLLFHGSLYWLVEVGPFTAIVLCLYLSFVPPDRVRAALARMLD